MARKAKLVDAVGGMDEIRTFLETRKIDKELPVVDWTAPRTAAPFLLGGMLRQVLQWSGLAWLDQSNSLGNLNDDKLLLDGMVSVWQVER